MEHAYGMTNRNGRAAVDILRKVEKDLQHMPRHQWDSYLWDFCRQFVRMRDSNGGGAADPGVTARRDVD
jgi:hypothetical protein